MITAVAILVFLLIAVPIAGLGWSLEERRRLRGRLARSPLETADPGLLRPERRRAGWSAMLDGMALARRFDALAVDPVVLKGAKAETVHAFRMAMLLNGIDTMRQSGLLSCVHDGADVERTLDAFDKALTALADEKIIG